MNQDTQDVGRKLRKARLERHLSLATVAGQAGVSVASLSRIENNKQNLDVELLLLLVRILGVPASAIFGGGHEADETLESLGQRLARLRPSERTRVFLQASGRRDPKKLQTTVDDLLSAVDVIRDELLALHDAVGRRRRRH